MKLKEAPIANRSEIHAEAWNGCSKVSEGL